MFLGFFYAWDRKVAQVATVSTNNSRGLPQQLHTYCGMTSTITKAFISSSKEPKEFKNNVPPKDNTRKLIW